MGIEVEIPSSSSSSSVRIPVSILIFLPLGRFFLLRCRDVLTSILGPSMALGGDVCVAREIVLPGLTGWSPLNEREDEGYPGREVGTGEVKDGFKEYNFVS